MPIEFAPPSPQLQGFNITPPQYTDPLQTLAQFGQLRTQNLQRQNADLEIQQKQQQIESNKALISALAESKDFDDFYDKAAKSGKVLPGDLLAAKEHYTKAQQDAATLDNTTKDIMSKDIDRYRGALADVKTPEELAAVNTNMDKLGMHPKITRLTQFSDPDHVTAFANGLRTQSQIIAEAKDKATQEQAEATKKLTGAQTAEAQQKVDAGELAAVKTEIQAAPLDPSTGTPTPAAMAGIQQRHPNVALPPPDKASIDRFLRSGLSLKDQQDLDMPKDETALAVIANDPNQPQDKRDRATNALKSMKAQKDVVNTETELARVATDPNATQQQRDAANNALKRLDQSKLAARPVINVIPGVPSGPLTGDAAQVHGDEYLKTLPPSFAARLKAIATGNELAPTGRAAMTGPGGQLMSALYQYDPDFTPLLAQQRKETLRAFTSTKSGDAGGQLLALNTVIHHADLYLDAAAALKNGTFKPGNEVYNKVASMFGSAPPTNAALLARFFASETGKVATGGVPAEGEINGILDKMSTSGSPEAMEGAGKTLLQIAAGRMIPLKERRDKAHLEKFVDILGPDAQAVLQKRGFDPETMKPAAGAGGKIRVEAGGKIRTFDTEKQAQDFEDLVQKNGGTSKRK